MPALRPLAVRGRPGESKLTGEVVTSVIPARAPNTPEGASTREGPMRFGGLAGLGGTNHAHMTDGKTMQKTRSMKPGSHQSRTLRAPEKCLAWWHVSNESPSPGLDLV